MVAACAALALAVVLAPWYALAAYTATGWEGTGWARVALVLALATAGLTLAGDRLLALVASLLALAAVAYRVAVPPDFGFGFGGLEVPVERRLGCWIAVAAAVAGAGLAAWRARGGA